MKIREIMRRGAFTIAEQDCLGNAHDSMKRARIRHLPVTAGDGRLVGMLSERDLLAARTRVENSDWWLLPVKGAMQTPVHTAGPDDSLTEIAGRMANERIGAMPVVERGKLIGLATVTDILDAEVAVAMAPGGGNTAIAADAMTAYPVTVHPSTRLVDAAQLMIRRHVRHLPVVDEASTIVGMLSERDVRTAIGDPVQYVEMRRHRPGPHVRDVMSAPVTVVPFHRPLVEVAQQFADDKLGALPIVDHFGALIGIISYVDALRLLAA